MAKKEKKTQVSGNVSTSMDVPAVLLSTAAGVVGCNLEGQVTFLNQAAARLLEVDPQEVIAESARKLFSPFPSQGSVTFAEALACVYDDPYTYGGSGRAIEAIVQVGPKIIRVSISPVLSDVGEFLGCVMTLHDITQALHRSGSSGFILDLSHQLRAPLTAIRGYSEMLLRSASGKLDDQQESFLMIIQKSSDRLVALVDDLLDIARIDSGQLELDLDVVQMETIVHDVADSMQRQCDQKGLHLTVDVEPNLGLVLGDGERLAQVITSLADNACRRTPEGGSITLALSGADRKIRVDVADTGEGIRPEDQPNIFQRFYRRESPSPDEAEDTGLELAIAKELIEMHGGRMWVESTARQGTSFVFSLPLQPSAAAEVPGDVAAEVVPTPSESGQTVLVVEDDQDVSQLIALQLTQEGFGVLVADRGDDALKLAQSHVVDLITLDIMLPDTTGIEVLRKLKSDPQTADIPVIIVSVLQPDREEEFAVADHIIKPFTLERLLNSIRRTLAG